MGPGDKALLLHVMYASDTHNYTGVYFGRHQPRTLADRSNYSNFIRRPAGFKQRDANHVRPKTPTQRNGDIGESQNPSCSGNILHVHRNTFNMR